MMKHILQIKKKKYNYFRKNLNKLTTYHYKNSFLYNNFLTGLKYNLKKNYDLSQIPFLPARLFKEYDLLSIKKKNIYKTLYSSGTASDNFSKIYLDKKNAINQMKVLQKIFCKFIGNLRLPMLVVDKLNQKIDRNNFRASTAALNGFSIFANEIVYLLNEQNAIARLRQVDEADTLYCTTAPCISCTKLALCTSIKRIVADKDYPSSGKELWVLAGRAWSQYAE